MKCIANTTYFERISGATKGTSEAWRKRKYCKMQLC